jgi:hypothetical protein
MIKKHFLLVCLAFFCAVALASLPPVAQDLSYHQFADSRMWMGVPNFADVMSNLPFVFVGLYGLGMLWQRRAPQAQFLTRQEWLAGMVACAGFMLVAFGSGYYHWNPANAPLVWDRLPMTVAFMAIFSMMVMERISVQAGWAVFPVALTLGVSSVIYWALTDDLRLYAFVQFFPMVAIPLMLWRYPPRYDHVHLLMWMIFWYVQAKLLEHFDGVIYELTLGAGGGHALKHLAAAGAAWCFVRYMCQRTPGASSNSVDFLRN